MTNDTYFVHDVKNDEINITALTDDEQKELNTQRKLVAEKKAEEDARAEANATAKAALLVKLGITADEAKLLLG
jgi:hypothetical protein